MSWIDILGIFDRHDNTIPISIWRCFCNILVELLGNQLQSELKSDIRSDSRITSLFELICKFW